MALKVLKSSLQQLLIILIIITDLGVISENVFAHLNKGLSYDFSCLVSRKALVKSSVVVCNRRRSIWPKRHLVYEIEDYLAWH